MCSGSPVVLFVDLASGVIDDSVYGAALLAGERAGRIVGLAISDVSAGPVLGPFVLAMRRQASRDALQVTYTPNADGVRYPVNVEFRSSDTIQIRTELDELYGTSGTIALTLWVDLDPDPCQP